MPNAVEKCDYHAVACFQAWYDMESIKGKAIVWKATMNATASNLTVLEKLRMKCNEIYEKTEAEHRNVLQTYVFNVVILKQFQYL